MSKKNKVGNIVLFNGETIDIAGENFCVIPRKPKQAKLPYSSEEVAEALKVLTVSMSRIGRWNGHLRIPAKLIKEEGYPVSKSQTFTNGLKIGNVPANRRFMFYSVMSHAYLVRDIVIRLFKEGDASGRGLSIEALSLQALLHEIGETVISDIPGPLKKLIKGFIKPIENNIEEIMARDLHLYFPWAPLIKQADMLAQDIEGYYGYDTIVRGVNVSHEFKEEPWMKPALAQAVMITPESFYSTALMSAYKVGNSRV